MEKIENRWVWYLVMAIIIFGLLAILVAYFINFHFTNRGTVEVVLGGERVIAALEENDPDAAGLLYLLAFAIAILVNAFEIIGVLGDIFWEEFSKSLDIFKQSNGVWVRWGLRIFYSTLFVLDVVTNLLGLPSPTGLVSTVARFLVAVVLSTIEYPVLWFYIPFLVLWWSKKPMVGAHQRENRLQEMSFATNEV